MRLISPPIALASALAATTWFACGSATPDLSPSTPADRAAVEGAEADSETAPVALDLPETAPEDLAEATPSAEDAPTDETVGDPQDLQKEALELCQAAEDFLEAGEVEYAIETIDRAYELMLGLPGNGDDGYLQAKEDIRLLAADLIARIYRSRRTADAKPIASWDLAIQLIENEQVQREIKSMTTVELEQLRAGYQRSGRYRPMILAKLAKAGLPGQLSWLPLVESWFKVRALSRASALGMWQFISSTGLRYGLTRDAWVDERLDPEKSTDAAIGYLTDLHALFGDWPKALAAYNCGEVRVQRLSRRSSEYLDFWDLYAGLPGETRRYVPRLFAALQIIENPEKYGITLPEPDPPLDGVATVSVERSVKLENLDAKLRFQPGTLAALNPELREKATPKRAYELRVPFGHEETVVREIASVPEWTPPRSRYETHRVRSGEALSVIARRYGTSVQAIMRANNLRSANRIRAGQRLRIPVGASYASTGGSRSDQLADGVYTVRAGDSLHEIAARFRTSVAQLKAQNDLSSNVIQPGQRLRVQPASPSGAGSYRVASGDTLGGIADAHGVSLTALLQANGLSRRSTIYPGQKLVIPK